MGLSIFFYLCIFFCSPLIADFFYRAELVDLIRVTSLGIVIGAFSLVQQTQLTKRIDFKTQTIITIAASLSSGIVGITMALMDFGVWSLVAQTLSAQIVRTLMLLFFEKWRPKFRFSSKSFHELFGFGWKMMLSALLDSAWKEINQVVVGKFYLPATLGQYTRATQFSQLFSSNLTGVIQRVTYPVLSNIQDDRDRMLAAYRRIIKVTMFVSAVSMFFLGAIAEPLLYCLIGEKWHEAATYLPLICIAGSTYPLHAINLNMLQVQGRSDLFLKLEIIKKFVSAGPLIIGAVVGIMPMLYATLISTIINYFLNSHYSGKLLGYTSWMQLRDVSSSYLMAVLLSLSVFFFKYLPFSYWIILPVQIVAGICVFFLLCRLISSSEYDDLKGMIMPYIKKFETK